MKRFLAIILTLSIALSISMSVFAEGKATVTSGKILRLPEITSNAPINIPVGDAEYIEDSNGKLIKISDLMHFSNQQEADNYLAQLSKQLSKTVQYNPQISTATRSTHGDALVASKGVSTGTIELRVAYSTSGDSNTGTITQANAYTTFTGFTLGFDWKEEVCYADSTSSGKDIYAMASGELEYYFLIDGLIQLGRKAVSLDGYCFVIH